LSLVACSRLIKHFSVSRFAWFGKSDVVHAVNDVTLDIRPGETLGVVGESGCGKSTLGRLLLGLLPPTEGRVKFLGRDIFRLPPKEKRRLRAKMQIIFQDPFASLNPRKTIRQILGKPFRVHTTLDGSERDAAIMALLETVGLAPAHAFVDRNPHEFSGGQQQRIAIARALALKPSFVVADEAVSGLDLSVRAQILKLLQDLQQEFHLTYLFLTHDLGVVRNICSRVAVMYLGKLVEVAPVTALFDKKLHPYTRALISATPPPDPRAARTREKIVLEGELPSPTSLPCGCLFHTRCNQRFEPCDRIEPRLVQYRNGHRVACHLYNS